MSTFDALPAPEPERLTRLQKKFADFVTRNTVEYIGPFTSRDHRAGTLDVNPDGQLMPVDSVELAHYIYVGDLDDMDAAPITPYNVRSATFKHTEVEELGVLYLARGEWTYALPDSDEVTLTDRQVRPIIETLVNLKSSNK